MLVSVWGLLTALVLAHMPVGQPPLRRPARWRRRTALLGAPVMVVLFVLFPRIGPLWGVPQDAVGQDRPVEHHAHGWMAEVAIDDSVALRVRFAGASRHPRAVLPRPGADALRRRRVDPARSGAVQRGTPRGPSFECAARRCATR